uniref:Cysteine-rich protein 1 n=1 Tax=Setaria digitata TaxID=48799 RepID=A0A915PKM3_9BILA
MRKHNCGKCNLPVYFAELVQAAGRSWHTQCFRCANSQCGRFMDSRSYNDHKKQLYCNHCYKYLFGPKGVGYGIGAGVLFTASSKCKIPSQRSELNSEDIVTASISYTDGKKVQKPGYIKCIDDSFCDKRSRSIANEKRHGTAETVRQQLDQPPLNSRLCISGKSGNAFTNAAVVCRKCLKEVFDAEKILAGGMAWHRNKCFVCEICKQLLEPRTVCVRCGVLYCNSCYAKEFGPQGYGRRACTRTLETCRYYKGL